jgi:hypothetical protein
LQNLAFDCFSFLFYLDFFQLKVTRKPTPMIFNHHPPPLPVLFFLLSGLFMQPAVGAVNDVVPGDYYPPTDGITVLSVYGFHAEHDGPYVNGSKVLEGNITSQTGVLRAVRGFELGGTIFSAVAVLPWIHARADPTAASLLGQHTSGLSDARLGVTAWLINNKESATYLGVTNMLVAPTGHHNKTQILNAGDHRWKYILAGGLQKDLSKKLILELSPELVFYETNNQYNNGKRHEKDPSYALTSYLRYRYRPDLHFHVGGQLNGGGKTRVDGVESDSAENTRATVGATLFLPERRQVILRYAKDLDIETGYKNQGEFLLRYQVVF